MSAEPIPDQDPVPPAQPVEPSAAPIEPSAEAAAAAPAEPTAPAVPTEPVPAQPVPAAAAATVVRPSRRARATAIARRVLSSVLMASLLVLGIAIGYSTFVVNQPVAPVVGDPATRDVPTPPSVEEFVVALRLDDEDAIRAALPPDPYKQYTAEMQNWNFQEVTSVETLSTFADGPRAATQLVLIGLNTDGRPVTINLTVVTDGGAIVMFR